ncbi:MAG: 50S ribosomal protein L10, partial [Novibacillus thermophilus]
MASATIEEKKKIVEEITEKLKKSKTTVLTDYRGLNVAEVTELRKQLREAGVEFKVLKNTMSRRAAEAAGFTELEQH